MRSPSPRALLVLLLTLALPGLAACPPGGGAASLDVLLDPASYCPIDFTSDFPATRELEIGGGLAQDFSPYSEGQEVPLFLGEQGLVMITPTLRVKASSDDGAEACYRVQLEHDYQGAFPSSPEPTDKSLFNIRFVRQGDHLVSDGAIYAATTHSEDALDGLDVKLTVTVQGPGFEAEKTLHVTYRKRGAAD